jgi:hypothetical protein
VSIIELRDKLNWLMHSGAIPIEMSVVMQSANDGSYECEINTVTLETISWGETAVVLGL